jgi:hypothetical protein
MDMTAARERMLAQILGEGRADAWSDVDVALYLRDESFAAFEAGWREWAAGFGRPLVAFLHMEHHPWLIYDATPIPLRVDFGFHPEAALDELLTWPNAPVSAEAMVLYDGTGGRLTALAGRLVGQSLAPADLAETFERVVGGFWYYLLRAWAKLQRGQEWAARFEFNAFASGLLHALLRLEAGRVERWRASESAVGIEAAISAERLAQLDACIPGPGVASLQAAMRAAAALGRDASGTIAARHDWPWPAELADRVVGLM